MLRSGGEVKEETELRRAMPQPFVYDIRDKSEELLKLLQGGEQLPLTGLYARCRSRSELVATFLSVLELCSVGTLYLEQGEQGYLIRSLTEEKT